MELVKLKRLLAPLLITGVLSSKRASHSRLIERLNELQFVTRSVNDTANEAVIELQILDTDLLYCLLAGEANRFFLASRVSYERSVQNQIKNASWQAVEHYYSAYYAVHYLIRLTGISVTNLEPSDVSAITRSNLSSKHVPQAPSGLYIMKYNDASRMLILKKKKKGKRVGSHQEAWQLWDDLVDKLRTQTSLDPVEYARTFVDLSEHKMFIVKSRARYNPPLIRGAINYKFKGGVWVFEKNSKDKIDRLQRTIRGQRSISATRATNPESLIANNKIIIDLAKDIFLYIAERYPRSICRSLASKYSNYLK